MSTIEDVHDALTTIPGLLAVEDCCHFSAASEPWRERLSYAMRDIEDAEDLTAELQSELDDLKKEARGLEDDVRSGEATEQRLRGQLSDIESERDVLNRELGNALDKIKRLEKLNQSMGATS